MKNSRDESNSVMEVRDPSPLFLDGLNKGAVYAIGVQTAAARGALLVAPLRAALAAGRSCVLITPLSPEQDALARLLSNAPGATDLAAAVDDGRLKLFTAVGDYGVHLFLRGAAGYVQELEHFQVERESLIVIDQADDLFTPHDHSAVVSQSGIYEAWCARHNHTMVLLHLRTSLSSPLLGGNQAAMHHFAGVANVVSESNGLRMKVDFWQSPNSYQIGAVIALETPTHGPGLSGSLIGERHPLDFISARKRQRVWYIGPHEPALDALNHRIQWHMAASLDDCLLACEPQADTNVLIALDEETNFRTLVDQVRELRVLLGAQARIVVRESRYRVREHLQRQRLLRAGVDAVLRASEAPNAWLPLLTGSRSGGGATSSTLTGVDTPMVERMDELDDSHESGWLPAARFVHEAEEVLHRSRPLQVPCTLAEVLCDDETEPRALEIAPSSARTGDLATSADRAHIFLLHGCRERDAVEVVNRWVGLDSKRRVRQISLFSGDAAIVERLAHLRLLDDDEASDASIASESPSGHNIVAMPGTARGAFPRSQVSGAFAIAMALLIWQPATPSLAQTTSDTPTTAVVTAAMSLAQAYAAEQYAEVARLGPAEIERTPTDHALRLKVANSLAWTGQYPGAIRHYEALAGSPLAKEALLGLANVRLWSGQPHLAASLFHQVLAADPQQKDATAGLAATGRQLRPLTTVRLGGIEDSNAAQRVGAVIAHRWRDASLAQVFELSAETSKEQRTPDVPNLAPRELAFAYGHLGLPIKPRLVLTAQNSPQSRLFGELGVNLLEDAVTLEVGHVNWGKLVFSPLARRDGLTANRISVSGRAEAAIGRLQGSLTHFTVSDGNRVKEVNLQYTPSWQPAPARSGVRVFAGVYGRKADRQENRYWSPERGYYTANVGAAWGRWEADWEGWGELKRSERIGGEGAGGWSMGLGGKRWLSSDWAVRADASYQETRRSGSGYRSKSVMIALERLW